MSDHPAPTTIIFDLDGTLVRGDSFAHFLRGLLLRSVPRAMGTVLSLPVLGLLFAFPRGRRTAVDLWLWIATAGMSDEAYEARARRFAGRYAGAGSARPIAAAVARLREHRARGHRVMVVTGSEQRVAAAICRVLGLDGVQVVGSTLVRRRGALAAGVHCYGPVKLRRLAAVGVRPPFACAYTDSAADLPLLLAAVRRYVVEPTPRQLRRIMEVAADCVPLTSGDHGEVALGSPGASGGGGSRP